MQVCLDSRTKENLRSSTSTANIRIVTLEFMENFKIIFYQSTENAVLKVQREGEYLCLLMHMKIK